MPGSPPAAVAGSVAILEPASRPSAVHPRPRLRSLIAAALLCALAAGVLWATNARAPIASPPPSSAAAGSEALSLDARLQLSAALGQAEPAYRIHAAARGLRATSAQQNLRATFARSGATIASGSLRLGLGLESIATGGSQTGVGEPAPSAHANRVTYAQAGVEEQYVNGPLGFEQVFTLTHAPAAERPGTGTVTLRLRLTGNASARPAQRRRSIVFSRPGAPAISYGALSVTDARGRVLPSHLALAAGRILLRFDARGARYPVRVDPLMQQGGKLTVLDAGPEALLGFDVALSGDGNTAVVGAKRGSAGAGAAWVFQREGITWSQQGPPLIGSGEGEEGQETCSGEAIECGFGRSVAISADGSTVLIGAPAEDAHHGAVWVFARSGPTWTQQGPKLAGRSGSATHFGRSVALSADGSTALIGGPAAGGGKGAAWVYTRTGGSWSQAGEELTGADESGPGAFGRSVALSGDGETALIGAPADEGHTGAVYLFSRAGETWSPDGEKHTAAGESGAGRFGFSVALSDDASIALVGARTDDEGAGAAWAYERSGANLTQLGSKLHEDDALGDSGFGYSVALSANGAVALIGGPRNEEGTGAAWSFKRSGGEWTQDSNLTGLGASGRTAFGSSVALSSTGATALVGGFRDDERQGASWVFFDSSITEPVEPEKPAEKPAEPPVTEKPATTQTTTVLGQSGVLSSTTVVLPAVRLAKTGNVAPLAGSVRVRLPGSRQFISLTEIRQVPFGTTVDASHGEVSVTTARLSGGTQSMTFYAGEFKLTQNRHGEVISLLAGGSFAGCPAARRGARQAGARAASSHKHVVRKLWASGHGSYSTKGGYASGAVLGTRWLTEDRCDGTLIRVATDKVAVTNLITHRRKVVHAGHSIFVKAP